MKLTSAVVNRKSFAITISITKVGISRLMMAIATHVKRTSIRTTATVPVTTEKVISLVAVIVTHLTAIKYEST